MAKLNEAQIRQAFQPFLHDGEELRQWAYGIRQPNMLLMLPLFALAVLPGVIAVQMLTKNYLVGLSDTRLIILQIKSMSNAEVQEISEYDLSEFTTRPAKMKSGMVFTKIRIDMEQKPFRAKFHRAFAKGHRAQAMEIAAAISA